MNNVKIYTDGACKGNPGFGGWGVYIESSNYPHGIELYGGVIKTTNNRMEMQAIIQALMWCDTENVNKVSIYTDSEYVHKGITDRLERWKKNGWQTSSRTPVKNKDLWLKIEDLAKKIDVDWHWVKGHHTNVGNIKADILANRGANTAIYIR